MSSNQPDQKPPASVVSVIEPAQPLTAVNPTKTLDEYAKSILESHKAIENADRLSKQSGREAIAAAINAGQQLIKAKELVGHGNWLKWLADNCENLSPRTAQHYMKLANTKHVSYLGLATSLRQAYIVAGVIKAGPEDKNPPEEEKEQEAEGDEDKDEAPETAVNPPHVADCDKEILRKLQTKITTFEEMAANLSQEIRDRQYDTCDVDDVPLHFAVEKLKASLKQLSSLMETEVKDPLTLAVEECSTTEPNREEVKSGLTPACF